MSSLFKKGYAPWNKGLKYKLRHSGQFQKGITPWNKGMATSPKSNCIDCGATVRITNSHCRSCYVKASKYMRNAGHFKKGRISTTGFKKGHVPKTKGTGVPRPLNDLVRKSVQVRIWRSDIYTRDNFTCQHCFKRGGELHSHHIKPFSLILIENNITTVAEAVRCDELWNINNGQTLCKECHMKLHGLI